MEKNRLVREPVVAGVLYPDDPAQLRKRTRQLIGESVVKPVCAEAALAPYASYTYCGHLISAAAKSLSGGSRDRVVVLAPLHRDPCERLLLPESQAFAIPGAELAVDVEFAARLRAVDERIVVDELSHLDEHGVEVALPFIAELFAGVPIVPVLVGERTPAVANLVETVMRVATHANAAVLCMANLSSYGERARVAREAGKLVDLLLGGGPLDLTEADRYEFSTPALGVIGGCVRWVGRGGRARLLARDGSFRVDAEAGSSVEYAAISFEGEADA